MFNFSGEQEKPKTDEQPDNGQTAPTFQIRESDIHVMPKKFGSEKKGKDRPMPTRADGQEGETPKPSKKSQPVNWLFLGILTFIVLGSLAAVVVIYYTMKSKNQPANNNTNTVINQNSQPTLDNQNSNINNGNTNGVLETASLRDKKRIDDMMVFKDALDLYFANFNKYPTSTADLMADYLNIVPENPQPGGREYAYASTASSTSYQILFSLEQGTSYGTTNLTNGDYQLTPTGVNLISVGPVINTNINGSPIPPGNNGQLITSTDTDNDYLTDIEENIYKTDASSSDTDNDTYLDGVEVRNLYNPLAKDSKLTDTDLIKTYTNPTYNYTIFYPKDWAQSAINNSNDEIMFSSANGQFINILVQENPLGLSSLNWYLKQMPNLDPDSLEMLQVGDLPAVKSLDGLNTYLAVGNKIFIIGYNVGTSNEKYFETTYKMMLKSLRLNTVSNPQ